MFPLIVGWVGLCPSADGLGWIRGQLWVGVMMPVLTVVGDGVAVAAVARREVGVTVRVGTEARPRTGTD